MGTVLRRPMGRAARLDGGDRLRHPADPGPEGVDLGPRPDPDGPLERGFVLARHDDQRRLLAVHCVHSATHDRPGDTIQPRMARGLGQPCRRHRVDQAGLSPPSRSGHSRPARQVHILRFQADRDARGRRNRTRLSRGLGGDLLGSNPVPAAERLRHGAPTVVVPVLEPSRIGSSHRHDIRSEVRVLPRLHDRPTRHVRHGHAGLGSGLLLVRGHRSRPGRRRAATDRRPPKSRRPADRSGDLRRDPRGRVVEVVGRFDAHRRRTGALFPADRATRLAPAGSRSEEAPLIRRTLRPCDRLHRRASRPVGIGRNASAQILW